MEYMHYTMVNGENKIFSLISWRENNYENSNDDGRLLFLV